MKVKIFTEGGSSIGLGHISRCTSLYDEVASRGGDAEFIIHGNIENTDLLKGFNVRKVNWLSEYYLKSEINADEYCIVDSYLASESLYKIISSKSKGSLFIDDNARINYPKGIIVNPALATDGINYPKNDENIYLLGAKYIILRSPFVKVQRDTVNREVRVILITMGGSDIRGLTPGIIKRICSKYPELRFKVVVGNTFNNLEIIKNTKPDNVELYYNIDAMQMKELMLESDFAITAAGQTIYELLATQTPFIPIQIADNQDNNIASLIQEKLISRGISYNDKLYDEKLLNDFKLFSNPKKRTQYVNKFKSIIDGLGSKRIIGSLLEGHKTIIGYRIIGKDDGDILYRWANDKAVRENAFDSKAIEYEKHNKWFADKLKDKNSRIYIYNKGNEQIGQIRIDIKNDIGLIDYSVDRRCRGLGYGTLMLLETINALKKDDAVKINKLIGRVKNHNIPSQRAFIKAGYEETIYEEYKEYIKEIK